MDLISYAQNLEDVMLLRALGTVSRGFYIDVGAYDPDVDSVTRAFYERGWRGVNIEPVDTCFARLMERRPDDVNLQVAVAQEAGERPFYIVAQDETPSVARREVSGLSTLDPAIAAHHAANGFTLKEARLRVKTLSEICQEYVHGDIHFLKVDVEGAERNVLAGADFTHYRPWIVLVEATRPSSQEKSFEEWESILTEANYCFVWFDGLNRFYIVEEKFAELSHHFDTPPNVFDNYRRFDADAERCLSELREQTAGLQDALAHSEGRISAQAAESERLKSQAEKLKCEREKVFADLSSFQRICAAQAADLNHIRQEVGEHRAARIALENECQVLIAQRDACSAEVARLGSQIAHLGQKAAVLDDVIHNLRWQNGPRSVRAVLPLARILRVVFGAHVSADATNALEVHAHIPSDRPHVPSPPARSWKKRAALPFYRFVRPVVRPLAWRIRAFLVQDIVNELRNVPRQGPAVPSEIIHTIETALLTLALDKFDRPD